MELKEFVAQAIIQITEGVIEARKATEAQGATINPPLCMSGPQDRQYLSVNMGNRKNFIPQTLTFDILVNAETTNSINGKAKISVVTFNIGGEGATEHKNVNTSRITFSIPVCWPPSCEPEPDRGVPSVLVARSDSQMAQY